MRIGIVGYGNLGKRVESGLAVNPDMELAAVFTRGDRSEMQLKSRNVPLCSLEDAFEMKETIDVMINCCGTASDLPETRPRLAENFNLIDSFHTHAMISAHFERVDRAARRGNKLSIFSVGWDPGIFSPAMPNYFADHDTIVHLTSPEDITKDQGGLPQSGFVIHRGTMGRHGANHQRMENCLKDDSNPEFTAAVLIATARAAYRLGNCGEIGCRTVFNVVPAAYL